MSGETIGIEGFYGMDRECDKNALNYMNIIQMNSPNNGEKIPTCPSLITKGNFLYPNCIAFN